MKRAMQKILSAVLLAAIAAGLLCACQAESPASTAAPLPELKIGVDVLAPFYSIDEYGEPVGIDAEIAQEACRRAGYTPVFVNISWDEKDDYLSSGTVDCLWNAFTEDGREDKYNWTVPYMESRLRIIVEDGVRDRNIADLAHSLGVAVRAGSKTEEIFLNSTAPAIRIYSCGTFEMAQTAFVKGYASALACHEAVLQQIMAEYPGLYRFLDGELMTVHVGVAFDKDAPAAALGPLNEALREMQKDGTTAAMIAKYTAGEAQPNA